MAFRWFLDTHSVCRSNCSIVHSHVPAWLIIGMVLVRESSIGPVQQYVHTSHIAWMFGNSMLTICLYNVLSPLARSGRRRTNWLTLHSMSIRLRNWDSSELLHFGIHVLRFPKCDSLVSRLFWPCRLEQDDCSLQGWPLGPMYFSGLSNISKPLSHPPHKAGKVHSNIARMKVLQQSANAWALWKPQIRKVWSHEMLYFSIRI